MEKAVAVAKEDFATIRTGRAHPAMFNKIMVDYYGTPTPVNQLASFQVPEPRMAIITPYDKSSLARSRRRSATPTSGSTRPTTAPSSGSCSRSSPRSGARSSSRSRGTRPRTPGCPIRNIRRHAKDALDRLVKDGEAGEDDVRRAEKELGGRDPSLRRPGRRPAQAQGSRAPRGLRWRSTTVR